MAAKVSDSTPDTDVNGAPIDPEKGGVVKTADLPVVAQHAAEGHPENISTDDAKRPPLSELNGIMYHGAAASVTITVDDFKNGAGVEAPEDLVWNADNKFVVPISKVNAAVVDYLIQDPAFSAI